MDFDERLGWLILGGLIGFALGYIVRYLQEIKDEVEKVEETLKRGQTEEGFVRHPVVFDIALLVVVALTVWASFASQKASNDVQESQDRIAQMTVCNQQYLDKTIKALNERTTYAQEQATSNVDLQKAQAEMLSVLLKRPPYPEKDREDAVTKYFQALTDFVKVNGKAERKADSYPYPTNQELRDCLRP